MDLSPSSLSQGLELTSCVPVVRSLRALHYWPQGNAAGTLISARHHAATILHGDGGTLPSRFHKNNNSGDKSDPFPTRERISPYQTFVDMLTAKGNFIDNFPLSLSIIKNVEYVLH